MDGSICGVELECFRARRCSIGGIDRVGTAAADGELGISRFRRPRSDVFVLRLSWLGFLFIPGMTGLMKTGEDGSEVTGFAREVKGGVIDNPFIFFARLGAGDVMGLSLVCVSATLSESKAGNAPNEVVVREDNGRRFTGESGDEEGDGSDREDESVQDTVVVGEDSTDSEVCVDVLSWCLCEGSDGSVFGRNWCTECIASLGASTPIKLGSTTVGPFCPSIAMSLRSKTDMKEGSWSSYIRRVAVEDILV